jgi:hypothetical protein
VRKKRSQSNTFAVKLEKLRRDLGGKGSAGGLDAGAKAKSNANIKQRGYEARRPGDTRDQEGEA